MKSRASLSVLVVDEHPLLLKALASLLRERGFVVGATVRSASEALGFLQGEAVDVVVLGLPLRGEGGACLREIRTTAPDVRVVVCNTADEGDPETAFAEGAAVYVEKSGHPDDVAAAVRQAMVRSIFISTASRDRAARPGLTNLTPRELEVLRIAAEGGTNAEIARQLWVTEQTVKFHLANVYNKLGVTNRTEMSRFAQVQGLLANGRKLLANSRKKKS